MERGIKVYQELRSNKSSNTETPQIIRRVYIAHTIGRRVYRESLEPRTTSVGHIREGVI